jgi:AbrB family looped-hinge helix DNA binding protein
METHVTAKGQILIPAALRKKYGITAGMKITIIDNGDEMILRPMTRERIAKLRGSLKGLNLTQALLEERQKDKEIENAKIDRYTKDS